MISLEHALKENDILLVDGSAKAVMSGDYLVNDPHFALICEETLQRVVNEMIIFSGIMGSRGSRTIPEVIEEFHAFEHTLAGNYKFLTIADTCRSLKSVLEEASRGSYDLLKQSLSNKSKAASVRDRNKKSYGDLLVRINRCMPLLHSRSVRIVDPAYDELVEMIKTLDRAVGLKRATRVLMKDSDYSPDASRASDTDERLVATAYWISMFSDKSVGILTRDKDFFSLLRATPTMLGAREFLPYNKIFRIPIKRNPVRLYYRLNGDDCEKFVTSFVDFQDRLTLYGVEQERAEKIREKISQFWIHFADYHKEVGIKFEG